MAKSNAVPASKQERNSDRKLLIMSIRNVSISLRKERQPQNKGHSSYRESVYAGDAFIPECVEQKL